MNKGFYVNETDITHFGVFRAKVPMPGVYTCAKNDKPYSRFFYVMNGTIIFNKGTSNEIYAPAGNIVYLPNDVSYQAEWPEGETGEYISVNFQLDETYLKLPEQICIAAVDKNGYYLDMFKHVHDIWIKGSFGYKLEVLSEIYKIIYSMKNDTMRRRTKLEHQTIYKGIIFLENNYLEDISVETLAAMCSTSESNFRRLFKKYKKMSPITYKNYLRIKKAYDLLQSGEYNVTEAAEAVNISDICYFHKLFTRFINKTPKSCIP